MTFEEKEKFRKRRRDRQKEKHKWEKSREKKPINDLLDEHEQQFRKYKKIKTEPLDDE